MRNAGKIVIVVAAALSLAACSNGQKPSSYPPGGGPTYPAPEPAAASASASAAAEPSSGQQQHECTADDVKVTGDFGSKPTITIPDTCTAPTKLLTKDLKTGTGAAAGNGSTLQVNYDLVTWSDKADQQNSFGQQPVSVQLGADIIDGWSQGLPGIKQGGRRLLIIPPNLGYGASGNSSVKPNETLVFVVDAVQIGG